MRNPRSWRKLWMLLLTPALPVVFSAGCGLGITENEEEEGGIDVKVTLINLDHPVLGSPIHLFAPGETFPNGRLEPGISRVIHLTFSPVESASFQAGRNGTILSTKDCTCGTSCELNKDVRVEWNGSALSCVDWQ